MNTYQIPIKELFEILNIDNIEYETLVNSPIPIKIQSPTGFVEVNKFIKKKHNTATYVLENGDTLSCSIEHLVFEQDKVKKIKDCSYIDTIYGSVNIVGVIDNGINEVYDVSLDSPHKYVTPNGIIHHNTSLINMLINELDIDEGDVLEINASEETSVEVVRTKIINFASTIPFGDFKICILEEADALSQAAQKSLKRVIETNSDNCRFIFTTNEVHKINAANFSRFQHFHFEQIDEELFIERLMFILEDNDVEYSPDDLIQYVKGTYPDLRKSIGMLEMNVCDGKLLSPSSDSKAKLDYMVKVVDLFKKGKVKEARTTIIENASSDEYTEIFRFLYRNIELFGDEDKQCRALVIIRDGMYKDAIVADREINLSATLAEISMVGDE